MGKVIIGKMVLCGLSKWWCCSYLTNMADALLHMWLTLCSLLQLTCRQTEERCEGKEKDSCMMWGLLVYEPTTQRCSRTYINTEPLWLVCCSAFLLPLTAWCSLISFLVWRQIQHSCVATSSLHYIAGLTLKGLKRSGKEIKGVK